MSLALVLFSNVLLLTTLAVLILVLIKSFLFSEQVRVDAGQDEEDEVLGGLLTGAELEGSFALLLGQPCLLQKSSQTSRGRAHSYFLERLIWPVCFGLICFFGEALAEFAEVTVGVFGCIRGIVST